MRVIEFTREASPRGASLAQLEKPLTRDFGVVSSSLKEKKSFIDVSAFTGGMIWGLDLHGEQGKRGSLMTGKLFVEMNMVDMSKVDGNKDV